MKEILLVLIPTLTLVPTAVAAALAMRKISSAALEGMTRQPEIANQLFTSMLVSLALVEALVIYCLVVALLVAAKV
ncbi:MAG TPA: ATP synthase F0 subunit C [Gemmatimonadales bacterium]|jgi:F-type H+-transporting ATPase subunit c|nr:ATP synthase F0 subunit C [Gemmatimonadales bacterium]